MMRRFWGLHRGAEAVLTPLLAGVDGLDYAGRSKIALLNADLVILTGAHPDEHEPTCDFVIGSQGEGLGLAYVLEGSALGGSVIYREMLARGESSAGLGFFNPYGGKTGRRWQDFLAVLEREAQKGGEAIAEHIVTGAVQGFRQVESWLCDACPQGL
jgi:heme oxygenase